MIWSLPHPPADVLFLGTVAIVEKGVTVPMNKVAGKHIMVSPIHCSYNWMESLNERGMLNYNVHLEVRYVATTPCRCANKDNWRRRCSLFTTQGHFNQSEKRKETLKYLLIKKCICLGRAIKLNLSLAYWGSLKPDPSSSNYAMHHSLPYPTGRVPLSTIPVCFIAWLGLALVYRCSTF